MTDLLTPKQKRTLTNLAKDECASYFNGRCAEKSKPCLPFDEDTLCCKYFILSVLPMDEALYAELLGEDTKTCRICGQPFCPGSNRAIYCPECAERERKRQEATRQRERRVKRTQIG